MNYIMHESHVLSDSVSYSLQQIQDVVYENKVLYAVGTNAVSLVGVANSQATTKDYSLADFIFSIRMGSLYTRRFLLVFITPNRGFVRPLYLSVSFPSRLLFLRFLPIKHVLVHYILWQFFIQLCLLSFLWNCRSNPTTPYVYIPMVFTVYIAKLEIYFILIILLVSFYM